MTRYNPYNNMQGLGGLLMNFGQQPNDFFRFNVAEPDRVQYREPGDPYRLQSADPEGQYPPKQPTPTPRDMTAYHADAQTYYAQEIAAIDNQLRAMSPADPNRQALLEERARLEAQAKQR